MSYSVEILNLSKEFCPSRQMSELLSRPFHKPRAILVLNNINAKVIKGEIFGIVGPNGAGKTTLIKILCGLIVPTSGEAYVSGFLVAKDNERLRCTIGLVTGDERSFYWRLTCRQNLDFFATLYNMNRKKRREIIRYLTGLMDIAPHIDKEFQACSAGIKQRLAIARCLLSNPEVIFMDEPTKSLDPVAAEDLRKFIRNNLSKREKKTVVFTSHNLKEVEELADRVAIMDKGVFRACGTIDSLKKEIREEDLSMERIFRYYVNA